MSLNLDQFRKLPKNRSKEIIKEFILSGNKAYTLGELYKISNVNNSRTVKLLKILIKEGIIEKRYKNKTVYYGPMISKSNVPTRAPFYNEKDDKLILSSRKKDKQIGLEIGRSEGAVRRRRVFLLKNLKVIQKPVKINFKTKNNKKVSFKGTKTTRKKFPDYTKAEEKLILRCKNIKDRRELGKKINRTPEAIRKKRYDLLKRR